LNWVSPHPSSFNKKPEIYTSEQLNLQSVKLLYYSQIYLNESTSTEAKYTLVNNRLIPVYHIYGPSDFHYYIRVSDVKNVDIA